MKTNDSRLSEVVDVYAYQRVVSSEANFSVARRAAIRLLVKLAGPSSASNDDAIRFVRNLAGQLDGPTHQTALEAVAPLVIDVMAIQRLQSDRIGFPKERADRRSALREMEREFKGDRQGLSASDQVYNAYVTRNHIEGPVVDEARKGFAATIAQELPSLDKSVDSLGIG